MSDVLITY